MPLATGALHSLSVLMDWQAFWLTIRLATVVTAILLALGLPLAYWIAFSRWRWKFVVEAVVALPIVLPPTVLGFYVLIALGQRSPLGRWWQSITGHTLAFTFERSEEHTSELQSQFHLVCRLLLEKKKK